MIFKTKRLGLRTPESSDASFFFELMNSEGWLRHIGDRGIRSRDDALKYISSLNEGHESNGYGLYAITIEERPIEERPIGVCGLLKRDYLDHPDLGFALLPEFTGKGYIQEAGTCILDDAFQNQGLDKVLAITSDDNAASQATLRKLGFYLKGMIKQPGGEEVILFAKQKR
ncbi:MAG: GNAT family N-acetyltransferase [Ekhidna sp.]|uniref:GNAT family N-acetyltransferase n=1 Tax=Ekhidna sp. TaxID=2608089 RepID=UPI0032EFC8C4